MYKRSAWEKAFEAGNIALLALLGLTTLYPFLYVFTISLSEPADINRIGLHLLPTDPTTAAYAKVLTDPALYRAYGNTLLRTAGGVVTVLLFCSLTAYPLSRPSFPHRGLFVKLIVFSMLFNGGTIPMYLLIRNLGMIDSYWALILPLAVSGFNLIVLRNFFQAIPPELAESAKMDGAGELRIFARIVLPLSTPVLAVVALWAAVMHWNSWFDAMIYLNDASKQVLQLYLRHHVVDASTNLAIEFRLDDMSAIVPENLKAAIIMTISLPILLVYPFIQRFFVKGIMLGSVKG
ncbi:carbohydrate ABC transporter permease [Cohnella rhizosphaerae]|uniref:Carbohydrate ABC transporter permease n=1 Tax=Cohnella rhizosphaerae TaxID=1457232 RepID=A0A9X4L118_9BACL|nr:carbohydrate ABC transporter permease [Cohnella rhizosphaerae]MDG0814565.1 carbohydrate ABC transporter permease [Cohnella rhizosphaerae]